MRTFSEILDKFIDAETIPKRCNYKGISDNAKTLFSWSAFLAALLAVISRLGFLHWSGLFSYPLCLLATIMILISAYESLFLCFGTIIQTLFQRHGTQKTDDFYKSRGFILKMFSFLFPLAYIVYLVLNIYILTNPNGQI